MIRYNNGFVTSTQHPFSTFAWARTHYSDYTYSWGAGLVLHWSAGLDGLEFA